MKIHFTDLDEHQNKDLTMSFDLDKVTVVVKNEDTWEIYPAFGDEVFVQDFHKNFKNC